MYQYEQEKPELFTDEGQRMFIAIRDHVKHTLRQAGAIRMQEAMSAAKGGNTWTMLACVDRMVELGELRELTRGDAPGQHRVFVSAVE